MKRLCRALSIGLLCSIILVQSVFADLSFSDLTAEEKELANQIMYTVNNSPDSYSRHGFTISENSFNRVVSAINNAYYPYFEGIDVYIENYYADGTFGYLLSIRNTKLISKIGDLLNKKAKTIVKKKIKKKKKMSTIKKANAIAKGIASLFKYKVYSTNDELGSAYKNLKRNKAYCEIYSYLFRDACRLVGIHCQYLEGVAGGTPHGWNRIRVGGKWRYYDVTWYDGTKNKKYLGSKKLWKTHKIDQIVAK